MAGGIFQNKCCHRCWCLDFYTGSWIIFRFSNFVKWAVTKDHISHVRGDSCPVHGSGKSCHVFFPSLKYSKNMDYNNKINYIADIQPHITPWHNSPPAAYGMNHNTGACCFLCEPTHPPVILACHATMSLPAEVGDLEEQLVNHTGYTLPYRDYFCLHDASGVCCGRRVTRRKVTRLPRAAPWLLACRESLMGAVVVGC